MGVMAISAPRCQVLVRFFPKMFIPILSLSSDTLGFGCVMDWAGTWDTNTAGAELWTPAG